MKRTHALVLTILIVAGCSAEPEPQPQPEPGPTRTDQTAKSGFERTWGGKWELVVDQTWDRSRTPAQTPGQELPATAYQPVVGNGARYAVRFSADGSAVEIHRQGGKLPLSTTSVVKGKRQGDASAAVQYALEEGLPAAGRFVVRQHEQGFQAELTIYGSGVPIVASERGQLSQE